MCGHPWPDCSPSAVFSILHHSQSPAPNYKGKNLRQFLFALDLTFFDSFCQLKTVLDACAIKVIVKLRTTKQRGGVIMPSLIPLSV